MKTNNIQRPPKHFSRDAKAFWASVHRDFELEDDASMILRAACEQWDRAQQAREEINRDGLTIGGKAHPALGVEKVAYGMFLRAMRQLGLDVVAPGSGQPAGRRS